MAAKKAVRKKKVASKQLVTMADLELQMAEEAELDTGRLGGGSDANKVSISGGSFTYQEADLGESLDIVILDFATTNAWYDRGYSKDENSVPACMAISYESPKGMSPLEDSPVVQSESCDECEMFEWGSGQNGSKACKDKRRLMMVSLEDLESESPEITFLDVPPTSVKKFTKYVKGLAKVAKKPIYGVVTQMEFDEEVDWPALVFSPGDVINDVASILKIRELRETYREDLMEAPDFSTYEAPAKQKTRAGKKKAGKKKGRSKLSK